MGVVVMGVVVTGCPKKNPYDSQLPKSPPKTYHWLAGHLLVTGEVGEDVRSIREHRLGVIVTIGRGKRGFVT